MLALGLFRLADWWFGGYRDASALLAGLGFLLLAAGTASRSVWLRTATVPAWRRVGMALAWLGLALVLAGILLRHFGPSAGLPIG
jgi:hypothetical protein